jgi:hypothetical protein
MSKGIEKKKYRRLSRVIYGWVWLPPNTDTMKFAIYGNNWLYMKSSG